jgi:hypothetical protein
MGMQLPAVPANLDAGGFFLVNQWVTSLTESEKGATTSD